MWRVHCARLLRGPVWIWPPLTAIAAWDWYRSVETYWNRWKEKGRTDSPRLKHPLLKSLGSESNLRVIIVFSQNSTGKEMFDLGKCRSNQVKKEHKTRLADSFHPVCPQLQGLHNMSPWPWHHLWPMTDFRCSTKEEAVRPNRAYRKGRKMFLVWLRAL